MGGMVKRLILLMAAGILPACSTRSDPTFMNNAAAAQLGGVVQSADGRAMMSPGLRSTQRSHPFFGTP